MKSQKRKKCARVHHRVKAINVVILVNFSFQPILYTNCICLACCFETRSYFEK